MFEKHYMSRAETRAMASDHPIGDPTGGASYGERNDPVTATVAAVGSSLGSGILGSRASKKAAEIQSGAADRATQMQYDMTTGRVRTRCRGSKPVAKVSARCAA